jgi:pilus assembly protein CpaF
VVLHLARGSDGVRRLRQVAVPERDLAGFVSMVPALDLSRDGRSTYGPAAERLLARLER